MRSRKKGNDENEFAKVVFLALNTGESGRGLKKKPSQRLESFLQSEDEEAQGWTE